MKNLLKAIVLSLLVICIAMAAQAATVLSKSKPIALDSRIKTYIYSENEVFRLVIHYGYQTSIEFAEGEEIQTISVGNNYAWQITPVEKRLFIKPLEDNISTNMTILTNKRSYQFDLESRLLSHTADEELVYVVRFFFPEGDFDAARPQVEVSEVEPVPAIKPFNFNYTLTGCESLAPLKVFDDGINTFFKFPAVHILPKFQIIKGDLVIECIPRRKGEYIILNTVAPHFRLMFKNQAVNVYNEKLSNGS